MAGRELGWMFPHITSGKAYCGSNPRGREIMTNPFYDKPYYAQQIAAAGKSEKPAEKELQQQCEKWLHHRPNWARLTAENAAIAYHRNYMGVRHWWGHLNKPAGNPIMPDLFVFDADGKKPPLFIELKASNRYQPGQREMILAGFWLECRTFEEVRAVVEEWEGEG